MMKTAGLYFIAVLLTGVLTSALRHYALKNRLLDVPNERSSHQAPTPRGGGIAMVIVFLGGLFVLYGQGLVARSVLLGMGGAGIAVAVIGFWDDKNSIGAGWRLLVHFAAAGWGLFWLGGFPALVLMAPSSLWAIAQILGLLYLVWLLNLYNFMDGIDGLAGVEAITVCIGSIVLLAMSYDLNGLAYVSGLLASTVAGFLVWNFPPAKIFMGDAGSGFLGLVLGLLSVQAGWLAPHYFWSWLILLGVFIVDATVTLFRRLWHGERVHQAHRSHAYQYAARLYQGHKPVTLAVAVINLIWLLPIALSVTLQKIEVFTGLLSAYLPLTIMAFYFKAGLKEKWV